MRTTSEFRLGGRPLAATLTTLLVLGLAGFGLFGGSGASAQTSTTCDTGYGCPPTSPPTTSPPACSLSANSGNPGDTIVATITGVPAGTVLQVTFNGTAVASGTAGADGIASIRWTIPNVSEGRYAVFAVGPGISAECSLDPGFRVLAEQQGGGGGGGLAFTGANVLIMVAIALVLLIAGRAILQASRRRQRRLARHASRQRASVGP